MKFKDWLPFIFYCLIVVGIIVIAIVYVINILNADIPWWLKISLLKGR